MMLHPKMQHVYVGIDVHKHQHTAVVVDCFSEKLGELTFPNKKQDFPKLLSFAKKHIHQGITPVWGLEDVLGNGRELAIFLLEKNYKVKYVNPSLSQSERKNQASINKSDSIDSQCVANVLLNKLDSLPDAAPNDLHWALNELVTKRNTLVKNNVVLKNQIHTYLSHHYPNYKSFFFSLDSKTALEFFKEFPSPSKLKEVTLQELTAFLSQKSHHNCSEKKARQILDCVEKDGDTTNEFQELRDFIVTSSIKQINDNLAIIASIEENMKKLIPQFRYKLESMKGINTVTAAGIIAEIGDISRFPNADALAAYAGISPMRYSTGQTNKNFSNKLGNRNLYQIFFQIAVSVLSNPMGKPTNDYFYEYYKKKLSEGKTKKQAIKCIMRKLVNIIYKMMRDKTEYRARLTHVCNYMECKFVKQLKSLK